MIAPSGVLDAPSVTLFASCAPGLASLEARSRRMSCVQRDKVGAQVCDVGAPVCHDGARNGGRDACPREVIAFAMSITNGAGYAADAPVAGVPSWPIRPAMGGWALWETQDPPRKLVYSHCLPGVGVWLHRPCSADRSTPQLRTRVGFLVKAPNMH